VKEKWFVQSVKLKERKEAFVSLFKGENLGRTLVKIGPHTLNSD
jgi:NADPH-dependent curcumin reductase CurA